MSSNTNISNNEMQVILTKITEAQTSLNIMKTISKNCKGLINTEEYNYCYRKKLNGLKYLIEEFKK